MMQMQKKPTSQIRTENGTPKLYINGELQEGLAYITYLTQNQCYGDFAKAGYRLFSFSTYFGSNHLNERTKLEQFTKGIFDGEEPDFAVFDREVEKILEYCPDAYILPRVSMNLSRGWEAEHPEELMEQQEDGSAGRVSYASDLWAEEVKKKIALFVAHIEEMPYGAHIVGFQVAGGNSGEWLPMQAGGISGKRMEEKYARYLAETGEAPSEEAYFRCYHQWTARRIDEFAGAFKEACEGRLIIGAFYGYIMETPTREAGHAALDILFRSKNVDFFCSPISYKHNRTTGRDHPYIVPLASMKLHGKLYFSENDTRTSNSRPVEGYPQLMAPIWYGPDKETSCNVIKMHAARALVNGHAAWWFDMWGGWYKDAEYMDLMKRTREIFEESKQLSMSNTKEVAVFFDAELVPAIAGPKKKVTLADTAKKMEGRPVAWDVVCEMREVLGKMGAPYDIFISSDAEEAMDKYKAVISLVPAETENSRKIKKLAAQKSKALLEITGENGTITTEEYREFLKNAGVHLWCERDAVVYANENYVFLHTVEEGEYTLRLPGEGNLVEVYTGEEGGPKGILPKGKSYLYRIV